jgi:hypothetical protein
MVLIKMLTYVDLLMDPEGKSTFGPRHKASPYFDIHLSKIPDKSVRLRQGGR